MMQLGAFKPFYSFPEPYFAPRLVYGLTHAYNRTRARWDWDSFSVIRPASKTHGALFLGQIPITNFHEEIVEKLVGNGLVVSCNDNFELSGVGSFCKIISPHSWAYYDIEHQHLPFADFSSNADLHLVIQTLEKMSQTYKNRGSVYVHCKAGRSRSALICALFLCINEHEKKQKILDAKDDKALYDVLIDTINELQALRVQVDVERAKLTLGVDVLKSYIKYWNNESAPLDLVGAFSNENELNIYQLLNQIAQSDEYKFTWEQAYKNPSIFPIVKNFSESIYTYAENNTDVKASIEEYMSDVAEDLDVESQKIIFTLHLLYTETVLFVNEVNKHSEFIQNIGLDLLDKVLKSKFSYVEKINWLKVTTQFLREPNAENTEKYNKEIHNALIHARLSLQIIGGTMIVLGAAVVIVSLVAGALATGGFLGVSLATFAASAFGVFQMTIGALICEHGVSDYAARASRQLVNDFLAKDEGLNDPALKPV